MEPESQDGCLRNPAYRQSNTHTPYTEREYWGGA